MPKRRLVPVLCLLILAVAGPARGADRGLLVVSPEAEWLADVEPLLALRRGQGWAVTTAVLPRPDAHRLADLVEGRLAADPRLSHVLLLGSDRSLPMTRRPNRPVQALDGAPHVYTDDPYGAPGADGVPGLAVGRIPCDDAWGIGVIAAKTVRYEAARGALSPEGFLIVGRTPASRRKALGLISPQALADGAARSVLEGFLGQIRRLTLRVRTAFDGPGAFSYEEAPAMLAEELGRRPWIWAYAGHASAEGLATYHSQLFPDAIRTSDVYIATPAEVTGPFISAGCDMAAPVRGGLSFVEALLRRPGGPPAVVGFTGVNEDYWVAQWFQGLLGHLDALEGPVTLGELVLQSKRDMVATPQSELSLLVQRFMASMGQLLPDAVADYAVVVRRNNELLVILGDPCLTVGLPPPEEVGARGPDFGE